MAQAVWDHRRKAYVIPDWVWCGVGPNQGGTTGGQALGFMVFNAKNCQSEHSLCKGVGAFCWLEGF